MEPISGSLQTLGSFRRTHVTTRNQAIRRWLSVKARGVGKSNFLIGANRNRLPGEIIVVLRYVYMELEKWTENSAMTDNVRALRSAAFRPERRHGKLENLLYGDLEMHAITGRDARCLSRPTRRTELCVNGSCG